MDISELVKVRSLDSERIKCYHGSSKVLALNLGMTYGSWRVKNGRGLKLSYILSNDLFELLSDEDRIDIKNAVRRLHSDLGC